MGATEAFNRAISFLWTRKRAYKLTFGSLSGQEVLMDLAPFCRAMETTVVFGDRDKMLIAEGRRQVFIRITQHLHLSAEELYALYDGRNIQRLIGETEDA